MGEPETIDGVIFTYSLEDTLFGLKYFDVPEINILGKVKV